MSLQDTATPRRVESSVREAGSAPKRLPAHGAAETKERHDRPPREPRTLIASTEEVQDKPERRDTTGSSLADGEDHRAASLRSAIVQLGYGLEILDRVLAVFVAILRSVVAR